MNGMNPLYKYAIVSLVLMGGLCALLPQQRRVPTKGGDDNQAAELVLFCAAGMRGPLEEVADSFQAECGVNVRIQYGGSNTLLSQIEVGQQGDLYLAADDWYLQLAREKGLADEIISLAQMTAVVGVAKGNPHDVADIDDLMSLRVAIANPDQAAIGQVARTQLEASGDWERFHNHVRQTGVYKPTVGDVANDVKLGSADAGVLWDAVAAQYPEIDIVRLPELSGGKANIGIGVLRTARVPATALRFCRYLAASDRGLAVFERLGYMPVESGPWSDKSEFTFYAGAVNRQALEPIVKQFAQREGVTINTVYNGCGILNAQLESLGAAHELFPDAYMPCDVYYLNEVDALFRDPVNVSNTRIVIIVAKDNPKGIQSLADLHQQGVRVALGQPEQCTIGVLSRKLLASQGLYEKVLRDNVVTQTASSSLLVPSVVTGASDAALVYATDARAESDKLTIVPIDSPLARAVQPFSVSRSTTQKQLAGRLREKILASRAVFESVGFGWEKPD